MTALKGDLCSKYCNEGTNLFLRHHFKQNDSTHTHVLDAARFVNHGSLGTEWVFGGWTENVCAMSIQWWTESVWDCV